MQNWKVQIIFFFQLLTIREACYKIQTRGKRNVQGVPQSPAAALSRHQEEEEIDKTKQAQIEQTYEKHQD